MEFPLIRLLSLFSLCTVAFTKCASSAPEPTPPSPVLKKDTVAAEVARWIPRRTAGTWHYELQSDATVALIADSSGEHVPVQSTVLYTITMVGSGPQFTLNGTIDSVTVSTGGKTPELQSDKQSYTRFSGQVLESGKVIGLKGEQTEKCAEGISPLIAASQGLLVPTPPTLAPGAKWYDTVTTVTCRGETPIKTVTVREYHVVGSATMDGKAALEISGAGAITIESPDSTPTGSLMKVTGSGTSTSTLYIDPATGVLLSATDESHSTLTVATARSTLPFRQDGKETVRLVK